MQGSPCHRSPLTWLFSYFTQTRYTCFISLPVTCIKLNPAAVTMSNPPPPPMVGLIKDILHYCCCMLQIVYCVNSLEISPCVFTDASSAAKTRQSKTSGFDPCSGGTCGRPAVRPLVDTGAMVFVVFGILGLNRTEHRDNHVIGDMVSWRWWGWGWGWVVPLCA